MTQLDAITLLLKVVLPCAAAANVLFIGAYTRLAPWWRDQIGVTIVAEAGLVVAVLIPSALSVFFQFTRFTSYIAAWLQIGLVGLITPVMLWRIVVFYRARPRPDSDRSSARDTAR